MNVAAELSEDQLSQVFNALANSTRRALLKRLAEGAATVSELAAPFNLSLPAISKHLKVLRRAGLVTRGQQAQFRPCTLDPEPLQQVSSWAQQCHEIWQRRFDQMDACLQELQTKPTNLKDKT